MKALSIKQPWAWAILNLPEDEKKDIENRTWNTKFRGEFLVHASKGFDDVGYQRMCHYLRELDYIGHIPSKKEFVYGAIIGTSHLVDVVQDSESLWFEGEYGFVLKNSTAFDEPIPYKGQLNFFNVDEEIIKNHISLVKKTLKGHNYIKVSLEQMTTQLNGYGVCDSCCTPQMQTGYLIPVLNSVYCDECFTRWSNEAEYYEEDIEYESMKTKQFINALKK